MKPLAPVVERAICRDYTIRRGRRWRYTTEQIADRHGVTQWTVNLVRLRNGLWRNESNASPRTLQLRAAIEKAPKADHSVSPMAMYRCVCGGRSKDPEGHAVCHLVVA